VEVALSNASVPFNRIWLAETNMSARGQLVTAYAVDACIVPPPNPPPLLPPTPSCPGGWTFVSLNTSEAGASVGAHHIVRLAAPLTAARLRVRVLSTYAGLPTEVSIAAYTGSVSPGQVCTGAPVCGAVLASAGGQTPVHSNGAQQCNATAVCGAGNGTYGPEWSSLELAQRWMALRYGMPAQWPRVSVPGDMCAHLPPGMNPTNTPAAGDLMVIGAAGDAASHAGVISAVTGGTVAVWEQNGDVSGTFAYPSALAACFITGA
jgi:hypothetical protein